MTELGPEDRPETDDEEERLAQNAGVIDAAWERTVEDMRALEAEREEAGWDAVSIVAGDTAPTNPSVRDDGRFGLVFVIPGNEAEPFEDAFERGSFPQYDVYRNTVERNVFLVVEYLDPDERLSILVGGRYELRHAGGMVNAAKEAGELYTYVQKLDGTVLGSFRHDEYAKFVPDAAEFSG